MKLENIKLDREQITKNTSKTMRVIMSFFAIFLVSFASVAEEIQQQPGDEIVTWQGVEIVTNDIELTGLLRNLINIFPGDQYRYSDPHLKAACNRVREFFPRSSTNCRGILMDGGTSLYVVEFSLVKIDTPLEILNCSREVTIDPILRNLYWKFYDLDQRYLLHSDASLHEFINSQEYLDLPDTRLHAAIKEIHDRLIISEVNVLAATHACNAQERALAFQLLNYLGTPSLAVAEAIRGTDDPDIAVRNNTMRLISVFAKYLKSDQAKTLLATACENINSAEFLDRNKGLSIIDSFQRNQLIRNTDIKADCQARIKYFSETSISDQIGRFARIIEKRICNEKKNAIQSQISQ